jgi:hypothetical protein
MPDKDQPFFPALDPELARAFAQNGVFVPLAIAADLTGIAIERIEDAVIHRKIRFDWINKEFYVDLDQVMLMKEQSFEGEEN